MLHQETTKHIENLSDSELLEYVLTGERIYDPEAVDFAKAELERRGLSPEQLERLRPPIIEKLARYDAAKSLDLMQPASASAILCQACGFEVPNKFVIYRQNIGAIHLRFFKVYRGCFCRRCNRRLFWRATLITLFLGWWELISFFVTIGYLLANVFNRLRTLPVPPAPPGAGPPQLDDAAIAKIAPHVYDITEEVTRGVDISDISREVAPRAGVTPGQALCFILKTIEAQAAARGREKTAQVSPIGDATP